MMKRLLALLAVCIMLPIAALADVWEGATMVNRITTIDAPSTGILETLDLRVGQTVAAKETLGSIRANRVYAAADGSVAHIVTHVGEETTTNAVLEVNQVSPYIVYFTVDRSYITAENRIIHNGQTLYLRCTDNGTHRAIGFAHSVNGNEFTMEITAGELYIGETVYAYSDASCDQKYRVGIGTVVSTDVDVYTASGTVLTMRVSEGQSIARGQLLYTWADGDSLTVQSPADGIITAMKTAKGGSAKKDAAVAEMAAYEDILIEIQVTRSQLNRLSIGDAVTYVRAVDLGETQRTGVITHISELPENDLYTVRIKPDMPETLLGMTVEVTH